MTERTTIPPNPSGVVQGADPIEPSLAAPQIEGTVPAGAVVRLVAYLLDALLIAIAIYLVALILRAVIGPTIRITDVDGVPRLRVDRLRSLVDAMAGTTIAGIYFIASWLILGGTPAQRLFRARVQRADDGERLHVGQAVSRWLLLGAPFGLVSTLLVPVPVLGAMLAVVIVAWDAVLLITTVRDRRKRGLHDRIAGSVVRREPRPSKR
jgi:uncharacterized RDD family membrane protein YckC